MEERNPSLTGNRARQHGFSTSRRSHEQHTLRDLSTQCLEFLRILQEFDHFFELLLGFIHTSNIIEGDLGYIIGQTLSARPPERKRLVSTALRLP